MNISCELKIKSVYKLLRSSEKKVADYVLSNGYKISFMSLSQLSSQVGVSEPTIMRFVKSIGFQGYSQFKLNLASDYGRENATEHAVVEGNMHIEKDDNLEDIPSKIIAMTVKSLESTLKIIDNDKYKTAIDKINKANTIDIYGVGNSSSIANDIASKLLHIGLNCRAYSDNHLQQVCAYNLKKGDVAIAISHSGSTIDTVDAMRVAKNSGAFTIAVTNFKASDITEYADICFYTGDSSNNFYSDIMVSRTSQLAIVDMLYMGVLLSDFDKYTQTLERINKLVSDKYY